MDECETLGPTLFVFVVFCPAADMSAVQLASILIVFVSFVSYECSIATEFSFNDEPTVWRAAEDEPKHSVVRERTITLEFPPSPRRSTRRFPFLKALVSTLVLPPERRDMSFEINNGKGLSVQYSRAGGKRDRARDKEAYAYHAAAPPPSSSGGNSNQYQQTSQHEPKYLHPIEDVISDQEDNNLGLDRPHRTRGFFLINVLSRMLRTVNFTAVSD